MPEKTRASVTFVVLILAAASALSIWNSYSRYRAYLASQQQLAMQVTSGAANEIGLQVRELHRRVGLFAEEETALLARVARHADDEGQFELLAEKVARHFSDRLAFTVATADGKPMVEDFDDLVGEACQRDILLFAGGKHPHQVYIHPQPGAYHFDIMAPWKEDGEEPGVFFVSFHPTVISRLLSNSEIEGHHLYLLLKEQPDLIEVTARGARDQLERNLRLSPAEIERMVFSQEVPGTRWVLANLPDESLNEDMRQSIARQTGLFIVTLVVITVLMLRFLKQSERQRFEAETGLRRAYHELEVRIKDRTHKLTETNEELKLMVYERRNTERELREREATLRAILDTTVDGIVVIDHTGTVHKFNAAAERMFGYGADEVVGHNVNMLMPSPYRDEHDGYLNHYLDTGEKKIIGIGREVTGRRKDGTTFPLDLAVSEVNLGKTHLFTGILRNLEPR